MKRNYHKLLILSIVGICAFNLSSKMDVNYQVSNENADHLISENNSQIIEENSSMINGESSSSDSSKEEINIDKKVKVYLNPSVQTKNLYVNNLGSEAEHMNDIVKYMVDLLKDTPYIILNYNLDYLSLKESVKESNDYQSEIHFSLHSNAGGGQGSEIFTPVGSSHFGSYIYEEYTSQIDGFKKRGVKETNVLYEVKNSKAEHCALLELLFHDNYLEANYIVKNKEKIAKILSESIISYIKEFYFNIY